MPRLFRKTALITGAARGIGAAIRPLRRFGQPEEVAAVAVMLASDEATIMTGSEITLDGGLLAGSFVAPRRPT